MDKIMEAIKKKYETVVKKRYMSEIRGDILKEFLLAIHFNNIGGEGEILENDGSVRKLLFPSDDKDLKELILSIKDDNTYFLIWNPAIPEDKLARDAGPNFAQETVSRAWDYSRSDAALIKPEIARILSRIQNLIESYLKEFELWGVVLTDREGNPLVWRLLKKKFLQRGEEQASILETTMLELVRLFVKSESEFIGMVRERLSGLSNLFSDNAGSEFNVIISSRIHTVRAIYLNDNYVLVLIVAKNQLGISTIVENKISKELMKILRVEEAKGEDETSP